MLKLDSHQHFWIFDPLRDSWITEDMINIQRDFLPEDLKPVLDQNKIRGCIAVQADQSEKETGFLLNLAENNDFIKGVVGWTDLRSPGVGERLKSYKLNQKLKGFRHIVQAEQPGFMLEPDFLKGVAALKDYGFTYDILIRRQQIKEAVKLVEQNPEQKFVLDHIGKPAIESSEINAWAADIAMLAANENVYCKLSGMVTEADLHLWKREEIYPYMDIVINAFGAKRIMFGSDWPVCKLAAEYEEVCHLVSVYLGNLSGQEQRQIWSETAIDFYKLDVF